MLNWPLWNELGVLYRKAGYALSETVRLQLLLCADDTPARNLLDLIEALGKDRAARRRWLQAFRSILDGLQTYRDAPFLQLPKLASQLKRLNAARERDLPRLVDQCFADPQHTRPSLRYLAGRTGFETGAQAPDNSWYGDRRQTGQALVRPRHK